MNIYLGLRSNSGCTLGFDVPYYLSMANTWSSPVHDDAVVELVAKWKAEAELRGVILPFPSGVKEHPATEQLWLAIRARLRNAAMPYTVWVRSVDGKIGTLTAEVATPSAAKKSAEHLRKQRLVVTITDPDGETVDKSSLGGSGV